MNETKPKHFFATSTTQPTPFIYNAVSLDIPTQILYKVGLFAAMGKHWYLRECSLFTPGGEVEVFMGGDTKLFLAH